MATLSVALFFVLAATGSQSAVVHVISHSHCDPGYEKSFSDYYESDVKRILNSVVAALDKNSSRRFIWEEVSYLSKWWGEDASQDQKDLVRSLSAAGRLEFTGGGWVMHDEAVTSVFGVLNQMWQGADFMRSQLGGDSAVNEWHIDPFGHSSFSALLYSQLGYKSIVLNRIPNPLKQELKKTKSLEFMWKAPYSNQTIFTHVLDSHYTIYSSDFHGSSLEEKAVSFTAITNQRLQWYKHDQLLLPYGSDFAYTEAENDFSFMDSLISYINSHQDQFNTTVRYSTLEEYFTAVTSYPGVTYPTLSRDFFPYVPCYKCGDSDCSFSPCDRELYGYWSGFFTSKPGQKLMVRELEATLQAFEALQAFYPFLESESALSLARNTSALLQHHDGITGTSFPPAFDDYNDRLGVALGEADQMIARLKASVMCGGDVVPRFTSNSSLLSDLHGNKTAAVLIQNPIASQRSVYVSIDLPGRLCIKVHDAFNRTLDYQQVGSSLYVPVQLPAWGVGVVFLSNTSCSGREWRQTATSGFNLTNGVTSLKFNATNHLVSWNSSRLSSAHPLQHRYVSYEESTSTNVYILRLQSADFLTLSSIPTVVTASGPLVFEARQQINEFINVTLRAFRPLTAGSLYDTFIQWQTTMGPLPTDTYLTVASQFVTDFNTDHFRTYSSGYFPVERSYNASVPIQGSVYPLVGRLHVNSSNANATFAMVTKRPMGVTVFNSTVTTMMHRRAPGDNGRDDYATVMDDPVVIGMVAQGSAASMATAQLMQELQTPPTVHFVILNSTTDWMRLCRGRLKWQPASTTPLPQAVRVLAVKRLSNVSSSVLNIGLNVINTDERGSHSFNVSALFPERGVADVYEATPTFRDIRKLDRYVVAMAPLTMRSFRVQLKLISKFKSGKDSP